MNSKIPINQNQIISLSRSNNKSNLIMSKMCNPN